MARKTATWLAKVKLMGSMRILMGENMGIIMPIAQRTPASTRWYRLLLFVMVVLFLSDLLSTVKSILQCGTYVK